MSRLPTDLSGRDVIKALQRIGFVVQRQRRSHIILRRSEPFSRVVVPNHKTLRIGTLRSIINEVGLSVDKLIDLLR